jgi:hypothetical protein
MFKGWFSWLLFLAYIISPPSTCHFADGLEVEELFDDFIGGYGDLFWTQADE